MFGRLEKHKFKLHLNKCWLFHNYVEYLGHMIYPNRLGVQKANVETISQVLQLINIS
jgi:hypothetical protein